MITDVPKITQRSIIAYSAVEGNPLPGDWYGCAVRRGFGVDSLTTATVRIVSGENRVTTYVFDTNCRAVVNGTGIGIECKFTSTESPGVSYGVEGHGTLTVEVTTAGDANAGIAGATRQFAVKVLVLDHDMPYGAPNFLTFRVGENVTAALGASKIARGDWITKEVGTGYGSSKILGNTKVNGSYVDSGLMLHNDEGRMWISGTAARPGVYRVFFDLLSTVQGFGEGSQVYHPFEGGYGESEVIIWIYRDWLPGDLVLLLPNRAEAENKYALRFDHAPDWAGLGNELAGVGFTREEDGDTVIWRGAKIYRYSGAVSVAYHYLVRLSGGTWQLYGKTSDSETAPDVAAMTLLATASARGFADEQPPKQGWSENALMATGDARWYLPEPESGQDDNSGWYAYAGTVTLTPPEEDAEPVTVEVYARQPHVIPQYAGWNLGTTTGTEARYLANVGGAWHVTATLADVSNWSAITAAATVDPQNAGGTVAIPFCPAKLGDVGLAVEVPPPEGRDAEPAKVLHSLSNSFAGSGDLALFMDGIAGAMWKRYPMRRLLSLFSVGATVTMSITSSKRISEYGEAHNPDGLMPEQDNSGDYPGGAPSVAQIKAAGGAITVSTVENWEKEQTDISASASGSVSFPLAYALWSDGFPKYLEAILGRSSSTSGVTASYSHDHKVSGKTASHSKTYRVGEVESGGGGGGSGTWEITSGGATLSKVTWRVTQMTGTYEAQGNDGDFSDDWTAAGGKVSVYNPQTGHYDMTYSGDADEYNYGYNWPDADVRGDGRMRLQWSVGSAAYGDGGHVTGTWIAGGPPGDPDDPDYDPAYFMMEMTGTGTAEKTDLGAQTYTYTSGGWIPSSSGQNPPSFSEPIVSVTSGGVVTMTVSFNGQTITSSGQGSVQIVRNVPDNELIYSDSDDGHELIASAVATFVPSGGGGGAEEVAYVATEGLGGDAYATVGNATTASGSNKKAHGTTTVYFGEGRECNWAHRSVCAAAGGEGGMSAEFTATNRQRQIATTTTHGGQRRRGGPTEEWEYISGDAATWGTTTTTTATDETLPENISDYLAHGGTFHTGVIGLILAAAMGSLSATYSTTDGEASGSAFGYRQSSQTGEEESADIPSVSGAWTHISASSTNAPSGSETRGTDVSGSVDLSGELGTDWEQWGYSYHKSTRTTRVSVQIAITDSDYSTP